MGGDRKGKKKRKRRNACIIGYSDNKIFFKLVVSEGFQTRLKVKSMWTFMSLKEKVDLLILYLGIIAIYTFFTIQ